MCNLSHRNALRVISPPTDIKSESVLHPKRIGFSSSVRVPARPIFLNIIIPVYESVQEFNCRNVKQASKRIPVQRVVAPLAKASVTIHSFSLSVILFSHGPRPCSAPHARNHMNHFSQIISVCTCAHHSSPFEPPPAVLRARAHIAISLRSG